MLGLSTTAVQTLMDTGLLGGWKTLGGHRRISLSSVRAYQRKNQMDAMLLPDTRTLPKIMVVMQENEEYRRYLQWSQAEEIGPHGLMFHESLPAALIELAHNRPQCLVLELLSSLNQQQRMLDALMALNAGASQVAVYLFTQESNLRLPDARREGRIHILQRSLTANWLDGFVSGLRS